VEYQKLIPNATTTESVSNKSERSQESKTNSLALKFWNVVMYGVQFYEKAVMKVIVCLVQVCDGSLLGHIFLT
jgi:hypothetical protein